MAFLKNTPACVTHGHATLIVCSPHAASLDRLQLDYVDVVYAHRPDPAVPMEEIVRAFNHVIDRGYAFYWGTSEWPADMIHQAHSIADRLRLIGPVVEQPQYSILHRKRVEIEYKELYELYGLGITSFSPLACGILSGKYSASSVCGGSGVDGSRFELERYKVGPSSIAHSWMQYHYFYHAYYFKNHDKTF